MGSHAPSANVPPGFELDFVNQRFQIESPKPTAFAVNFRPAPGSLSVSGLTREYLSFGEMSDFTPVPEPSTWLTGALAAAAIFYGVCRRHLNPTNKRISR